MFALRIVKSAAVSICLVVFLATPTLAAPSHRDPGEFVTELGNRAIELLGSRALSEEEQAWRFRQLLREGFAVRKICELLSLRPARFASCKIVEHVQKLHKLRCFANFLRLVGVVGFD